MNFTALQLPDITISNFRSELLTTRYVNWLNDPIVVRYSEQRHYMHSIESCHAYFNSIKNSGDLFLSIESHDLDLGHIGNISVALDRPNSSADVSIMLGEKSAWGRGLAKQAWTSIVDYLLIVENFRKVTAGTMEVNKPMIALMLHSGMLIDSHRPRHFLLNGQEIALTTAVKFRA